MSNILFIGPYRQQDGWGVASRDYAKAFLHSQHEVTLNPIYLSTNVKTSYEDKWLDIAEKKVHHDYDIVIQNCLPPYFCKFADVMNVGLCFFESCNLQHIPWIDNINLLDMLLVASDFEKQSLIKAGVTIPIKVLPIPCDVSKFNEKLTLKQLFNYGHQFKFYCIGEHNRRKNVEDMILAFHREFIYDENVALVIKLSGASSEELTRSISQQLQSIKKNCGLYPHESKYRQEILITDRLTDKEIIALHNSCDCYVSSAFGESICLGALDALGFGKTPIVNKNSGTTQFIDNRTGFLVNSFEVPAIDRMRPLKELYRTQDTWFKIDVLDLQKQMRKAFSMSLSERQTRFVNSKERIEQHSYDNIGKIIDLIL